jgi:hypothetical protein
VNNDDVHATHAVDLVVDDLGENDLFLETHGEVAAAVEALARDAPEVTHARQRDGDQAVQELVHALAAQRDWRERVLADEAEEQLWLLEHDPVVTLGRRGGEVDRAALAARGVDVVETERGGLATWHGPGQLVGYPLLHLDRRRWRVVDVVAGLERGVITWLASRGVAATQRPDAHGAWALTIYDPSRLAAARVPDGKYTAMTRPFGEIHRRDGTINPAGSQRLDQGLVSSVMSLPSQIPKIRGFQRDENGVFQILRLQPSP